MDEKVKKAMTNFQKYSGAKAGSSDDNEANLIHNDYEAMGVLQEIFGPEIYNAALSGTEPYATILDNLIEKLDLDSSSAVRSREYQKERQERKDAMTSEQNDAEDANDTNGVLPADKKGKKDWMHQSEDDPDNWEYDDEDAGPVEDELHETSEKDELDTDDLNDDADDSKSTASTVSAADAQSFYDSLSDQIADQGEGDDTVQEILKAIRPKYGV